MTLCVRRPEDRKRYIVATENIRILTQIKYTPEFSFSHEQLLFNKGRTSKDISFVQTD
jgi:hypothetical protein